MYNIHICIYIYAHVHTYVEVFNRYFTGRKIKSEVFGMQEICSGETLTVYLGCSQLISESVNDTRINDQHGAQ